MNVTEEIIKIARKDIDKALALCEHLRDLTGRDIPEQAAEGPRGFDMGPTLDIELATVATSAELGDLARTVQPTDYAKDWIEVGHLVHLERGDDHPSFGAFPEDMRGDRCTVAKIGENGRDLLVVTRDDKLLWVCRSWVRPMIVRSAHIPVAPATDAFSWVVGDVVLVCERAVAETLVGYRVVWGWFDHSPGSDRFDNVENVILEASEKGVLLDKGYWATHEIRYLDFEGDSLYMRVVGLPDGA